MNELPNLLNDTWRFFRANIWGLWKVLFPIIVPVSIISTALSEYLPSDGVVSWVVLGVVIFLYPIIQAAMIFYISSVLTGEALPRGVCYRLGAKYWAPLFGLYILGALAMCGGFFLLIIPGLIVFSRIMFSEFYCLLYEQSPVEAFESSWHQTRDYQWLLLVGVLLIAVATSIPVWLLEKVVESTGAIGSIFAVVIGVIEYMLGCLITIFGYRVFSLHLEKLNKQSQQDSPDGSPLL